MRARFLMVEIVLKRVAWAGVAPRFEQYQGNNALNFVLSTNLQRRHLTASQLATVALEVERVLAEEAKVRQFAALKQNQEQKTAVTDELHRCRNNSTTDRSGIHSDCKAPYRL